MKTKSKKTLSGILAVSAVACLSLGFAFQNNADAVTASAEDSVSVNTLGFLEWEETTGATSYKVSSAYGEFATEEPRANVGEWLTRAAKGASSDSATVDFTITPMTGTVAGTPITYTKEFTEYIDYGYSSFDLADVYAPAKTGVSVAKWGVGGATSAVYKNNLLTYGVTFDGGLNGETPVALDWSGGSYFYFFDSKAGGKTDAVWRIVDYGGVFRLTANNVVVCEDKKATAPTVGGTYVYSVGIFDTYGVNDGTKAGETFYVRREKVEENGTTTLHDEHYAFVDNNTLADVSYSATYESTAMTNVKVDKAAFSWSPNRVAWTIKSGKVFTDLAKPDMLYYDNTNESVVWNAVEGATGYEWSCGNGAWQSVNATYVSVGNLLDTYQSDLGYLPIRVRAVNANGASEIAYYNIKLKTFFNKKSTSLDIATTLDNTLTANETFRSAQYYLNKGSLSGLGKGVWTETAFVWTENSTTQSLSMGILGGDDAGMYDNMYWLSISKKGELRFARTCRGALAIERHWKSAQLGALETGVRYFLRYGIDEVYATDGTTKVAERITIVVGKENGFERETLYVSTFDNLQYAEEGVAIGDSAKARFGFGAMSTTAITDANELVAFAPSMPTDVTTNLVLKAEGYEDFTKAIAYGSRFDLTETIAEYEKANYCKVESLKYSTDSGATYTNELPVYGIWNEETDLTVQAEVTPLCESAGLSLSLNGDIGVNLYVTLSDYTKENLDGAKMQITYKGEVVDEQPIPTAEISGTMAGAYKFSYSVAAKEIDTPITAQLVLANGEKGQAIEFTVRTWITAVKQAYEVDNATYAKDYAMAMAIESYCNAAKTYFDTTAEQPEKDETAVDFSVYAPTSASWSGNVTLSGISLITEANTTLRIYFKAETLPAVKVNGQEVTPETLVQGEDTFYYVEMKDISAKDLDYVYTFEFGEDNVSCSALTYGCTLTESSDAKSVNLLKALYAYNQAANTYFAE